ncbi:MAG: DNA internalization-related competence protein ComEC/Rec2 [Rhodocyclaceae bacterium]|nr:DNA internalization-related competence protein ComEC/Rec2 [Rhodocyclaceae bacterium]
MQMAILAALCGVLLVQHSADLPDAALLGVLVATTAALRWRIFARRGLARLVLTLLLGLAIGALYTTVRAQWRMDDLLASTLDGHTMTIDGEVVGLPRHSGEGMRFTFAPDPAEVTLPALLALSWYPPRAAEAPLPSFGPGQRMRLTLRLRRHVSHFNPGGFDYAGWQFARGIGGGGFVREAVLLDGGSRGPGQRIDALRDRLCARIATVLDAPSAALVSALAIGDQSAIDAQQWRVLRTTGTAHLVAISGLHVSIVAALAAVLTGGLWRRMPALALRLPAQRAALCAATLAALGYGALAGFGIPVTRAVLMVTVATSALLVARRVPARQVLLLALAGVVGFDPWAVLSAGFWLSFGAVAALMLALTGRRGAPSRAVGFARAQWGITLVTAPLLLCLFGAMSLVAPLANAIAIPVVSVGVVPWVLAGVLSGIDAPLHVAAAVMDALFALLEMMADWPWAQWTQAEAPLALVALALVGGVWLLLPRGTPLRALGAVAMLPMLLWSPPRPPPGRFEATVLDVGQGLAVHVRTRRHELLYDSGRAYFRGGGDAGERVVAPYLRAVGVGRVDRLVLSHDDNDHVGGAGSVIDAVPVVRTSVGEGVAVIGLPSPERCVAGTGWDWDGVRFAWLHPLGDALIERDNNRSCVLYVHGPGASLLLPGDIEARIEADLLRRALPASRVVVAPHHGSKTSSSAAFVAASAADHVIFASGRNNPFGHPAKAVVARWSAAGAQIWRTDADGAVHVRFADDGIDVSAQAPLRRRYWHVRD